MYGTPKKSTRNITMLTVLVSQILLIATTSNVRAQTEDGVFKKWPLAWICDRDSVKLVAYLSAINEDGSAIYVSATGNRAVVVSADGIIHVKNDQTGCDGMSLEELQSAGLTVKGQ
jgi:hypothetical protein